MISYPIWSFVGLYYALDTFSTLKALGIEMGRGQAFLSVRFLVVGCWSEAIYIFMVIKCR